MNIARRILSIFLGLVLLVPLTSLIVFATESNQTLESGDKVMRLYYDEPAELTPTNGRYTESWDGWHSSLSLGNGYVGATVFGGTERERVQLTEKSFFASSTGYIDNRYSGGLENFAETYIDFAHPFADVTDYARSLTLDDGIAMVSYVYNGVTYTREVFTSYPDRVVAIHLSASETGALDFTLAPKIPNLRNADEVEAHEYYKSGSTKSGTVVADAENATLTLSGTADYYNVNYEALYRVESDGVYTADNSGEFGTLSVAGATEATIYIALGTNYELSPEIFTSSRTEKLDPTVFPHDGLVATLNAIADLDYTEVRARHIADHSELYGRVELDLGGTMPSITTDEMLYQFNQGNFTNNYIYELYYQIGRYFEIATSRDGTLPSNLIGGWCVYQFAPWTGGNWYNINQQMNYWGVFAANLTETFTSYLQFNEARMEKAKANADAYVLACNPDNYTEPGTNGWLVGTGNNPYSVGSTTPGGHSGVGTVGMTTIDYWNYYLFTLDEEMLYQTIFTVLQESARFYTKFAVLDENGLYLCTPSASPEQLENGKAYQTVGCAFDQQMMYENNFNYLEAVEVVRAYEQKHGIETSVIDEALLATVNEQINHYDPVIVGLSGQIKEYREEGLYGEIGEKTHRHISQLMGVANGTQINSNTPAWLDAARTTLILRGSLTNGSTGWGDAQRMFAFARCGDGESAMLVLRRMANSHLYNNMWNNHGGVFQIDGNFGVMAAMSEMLVQSHEGYLNLLPAISEEFASGSVKGILARGNFTVDLVWENGAPTSLTVVSGSGSDLGIYYPAYTDVSVVNGAGESVDYEITDGVIRLSTTKGESYTVTGFTPKAKAKSPENLVATNENNVVTLSWDASASENATYNVYRAIESSPTYELLGSTTSLSFTDSTKGDSQATYCIKAYNDSTIESLGTTATVIGTPDAPQNATSYALESGKVQLVWDSVEGCSLYRIYADGEVVCESALTVAILSGEANYEVSAVYYGVESETVAFTTGEDTVASKEALYNDYNELSSLFGKIVFYDSSVSVDDAFELAHAVLSDREASGEEIIEAEEKLSEAKKVILYSKRNLAPLAKSYTVSPDPYNSSYIASYICDGSLSSRFAAYRYDENESIIVAEFDLGGVYSISEIDIYEFADSGVARSETTQIEFYVNGQWTSALPATDTATLGTGTSSTFHTNVKTVSTLEVSRVRVTISRLTNGYSKNLSIWELQIWGNNFNIDGGVGAPVVNPDKPSSFNYTVANDFNVGYATFTDRATASNFMAALHIGEALRGLTQFRLPIADSSRSSTDTELMEFLKGDNTYFTFEAQTDGTVYVVFNAPLKNFTEEKGWRTLASGVTLPLPEGETLGTLPHDYSSADAPYYLTRLQYNKDTGVISSTVAYTYCYALDFKAGETVSVPTPATASGLGNENLVVLVDSSPVDPYISSLEVNGEYYGADEEDVFTIRVTEDTTSVTLNPLTISDEWDITFSPLNTFELLSDYTIATMTVSNGTASHTYEVRIIRTKTSVLDGLVPTFGSAHTAGSHVNAAYPLSYMTDGDESTRMATYDTASTVGPLTFIYDLGKFYAVDTFYLSVWADSNVSRVGAVTIEGYTKDGWQTLTTFDMTEVGTATSGKVTASVTLENSVAVSSLRFTLNNNPSGKTASDGTLKGISVYEIAATGEGEVVNAPTIQSVTVNGTAATLIGERFYAYVHPTVTELNVIATAADASSTVTYTPSNVLTYDGRKQTLTITVTNAFGDRRTYTLVVQSEQVEENILLGTTPTFVVSGSLHANYPLTNMTDGSITEPSRAAISSVQDLEFEFLLDGTYDISSLTVYAWADSKVSRTSAITLRALIDGEWVDILTDDLSVDNTAVSSTTVYKTIDIEKKNVEALRLYVTQNPNGTQKGQSIWEVIVTGKEVEDTTEEDISDSFRVLTNVSLHSSFDFHVYVPQNANIVSLFLAGEEYDLGTLPTLEFEGEHYYVITLPVAAKEAAEVYDLTVNLNINGKTATGQYTVSLVGYLSKLIATDTDTVEKTLVKDILSYIRAAILYFNADITESDDGYAEVMKQVADIDAVLNRYAYIEEKPASLDGVTSVAVSGTGVARACFSLDAEISFILELEEGYKIEDFVFLVGDNNATVTTDGDYIYITVSAYRIKDTLSWTTKSKTDPTITLRGELSLASYYASDAIQGSANSAELLTLVERLVAFSESADAYRKSRM